MTTATKEKITWKIECHHTPETIDRLLLPIRKRGMTVAALNYQQIDAEKAVCSITMDVEAVEAERIRKNMLRIHDIISITAA